MGYDLIIIGAGPAGLAAAVYAARYKLNTLVLSKETGGMINHAHEVGNWPGNKAISGTDLMNQWEEHAKSLEIPIELEECRDIKKLEEDQGFIINGKYKTKTILLANGTSRRHLNVPGEKEFTGKGVSYCATCDAAFYKNMTAAVVGGNDSACSAAMILSEFADKVYIIYRKDKLRAEPSWIEQIEKNTKIEMIYNANVTEIKGDKFVTSVVLDNGNELKLDGLFIEIGSVPSTFLAEQLDIELDKEHYIKVDEKQETNILGVYASGDITTNSNKFKQVITAAAEGALAVHSIYEFIKSR